MGDAVTIRLRLQSLGFTEYEARAYLALLGSADLNGYEVAKASGMPRANVYPVLDRLVDRGAAQLIETPDGRRYAATPSEQLMTQMDDAHRRTIAETRDALAGLETPGRETPVFSLGGRDAVLSQSLALVAGARESLLVAVQPSEASAFAVAFAAARDRGVAITTLCMEACETECGGCAGDIHRYALTTEQDARWLLLVADEQQMVAAELKADSARAITTEQPLVVTLAAAYVRQSISLATLGGALGERFEGPVSTQARTVLDDLHPGGGFVSWFQRVLGNEVA